MEFKIEESFVVDVSKKTVNGKNGEFESIDVKVRENEFNPETLASYPRLYFMRISKELPYSEVEKCKGKKCRVTGKVTSTYDKENKKIYTNYYIDDIQQLN